MSDVNNFRGITLLSTLGKLFTKVLRNRLTFWSDTYDIVSDSQAGFRKGWGTIDNIVIIQSIVDYSLEQGEKVYCAFIDLRKAFDYLNGDCLWFKLLKSGIRGNMYDIIKHMYEETTASVKRQGILRVTSEKMAENVTGGVKIQNGIFSFICVRICCQHPGIYGIKTRSN